MSAVGPWREERQSPGLWSFRRPAIGTTAQLLLEDRSAADAALEGLDVLLAQADHAASRFKPTSELSLLNADPRPEVQVSPRLASFIAASLDWAHRTGGLVDPTIGAALLAAGYGEDFEAMPKQLPSGDARFTPAAGWFRVALAGDLLRRPPGVLLDLGSTAKAQLADEAAYLVSRLTPGPVLVGLGGDIATAGPPPVGGWVVKVSDDHRADRAGDGQTVTLLAMGLATSSVVVRRWRRGERDMHHIIDPLTGGPADGPWRTVTVAADSCLKANALTTAALVSGAAAVGLLTSWAVAARLVGQEGGVVHLGQWTPSGEGVAPVPYPDEAAR
ncbi:MAG: FAD:protein FMN transferase [Candidatus Dormibacteria bacterium]